MRLDKFLKVSRIIKRRPVAKEVADKGRCQINGKLAKSSSNLVVGDILRIQFGNRVLEVQINELKETVRKEEAAQLYTVLSDTKNE
ncbi:MAG TPA: RNA-binding S4 domain-containing protein [Candidatus Tetragenococcus pullicola]|nr:RNA-binding S4 domain-containing protein [Candidatus Tetragenococcus pullicola]